MATASSASKISELTAINISVPIALPINASKASEKWRWKAARAFPSLAIVTRFTISVGIRVKMIAV